MINIIFRDVLFNVIVFLMTILIVLIIFFKSDENKADDTVGDLRVEITWSVGNHDVDLYGRGPDGRIVWFNSKHSKHLNLLRDDLGSQGDPDNGNMEFMFSKGLTDGAWDFTVHLYRGESQSRVGTQLSEQIRIRSHITMSKNGKAVKYNRDDIFMTYVGQEETLIRIEVRDKKIISRNELPLKLRKSRKRGSSE